MPKRKLKRIVEETLDSEQLPSTHAISNNQFSRIEVDSEEVKETTPESEQLPSKHVVGPDPAHFQPDIKKKSIPENSSSLHPDRKNRNSETKSIDSISGDDFERTRKIFYGKKKVEKINKSPALPGARQSLASKRKLEHPYSDSELLVKKRRLQKDENEAYFEEISSYKKLYSFEINNDSDESNFGEVESNDESSSSIDWAEKKKDIAAQALRNIGSYSFDRITNPLMSITRSQNI